MNVSSNNTIVFILTTIFLLAAAVSYRFYFPASYDFSLTMEGKNYFLNKPDEKYLLPQELEEISGLSYYKDNQVICVQDENGEIFIYDLAKKSVVRTEKFGDDDDYEGVEFINDTVYILNSEGEITYFPLFDEGIGPVKTADTPLSHKNDTEGLGYNPGASSLLIATKEEGNYGDMKREDNAVYQVNTENFAFAAKPLAIVDKKEIEELLEEKDVSKKKHLPARPSGIFKDPATKNLLILCSAGKILLVYDEKGKLKDVVPLDADIFEQPEGITKTTNGAILIASEGDGEKGYLLRFDPKK